jgi:UDP-glucose 6-dehydrogenase
VSFYDSGSSAGYTFAINHALATVLRPTVEIITSGTVVNIASAAQNGVCTIYYEVANGYGYDSSIPTHYVNSVTHYGGRCCWINCNGHSKCRACFKAFIVNGIEYFLAAYQSPYQNTYFLMNGASTEASPIVVAKLAYENGGGYLTLGLPSVNVDGDEAQIAYLFKDLVEALSTNNNTQQTTTGGIYSQTGINLVSFTFSSQKVDTAEIGSNIQMAGGFLWNYDGYLPVENDFFLWPDSVEATWSATGGAMAAQPDGSTNTDAYYYQVTYEWADNQGNIYRSAPSIPVAVTTTGSGSAGSVTLYIPYLRLTYKIANPLKIVIYRWSVAHQTYYQVTSITQAQLNSTTTDYLTYVDTLADASIVGNNIIYTTGGVIENVNGPASNIMTLFDNRLWLVDAEDQNLLWYSKQVIEATPVEMSDLLTFYIAPSTASQGNTGPVTALAPMDDKLIILEGVWSDLLHKRNRARQHGCK